MHGPPLEIPGVPAFYGSEGCIYGEQLVSDTGTTGQLLQVFENGISPEEQGTFYPLGLTDTFAIQQLDWLRAIERGDHPETDGQQGLHDLACAYAMLESSIARRQVTLQEVLAGEISAYQDEIDRHYGL
jgi:1,5-anhydro-D-fructose reductase (1,5-anhydro-D-mannitol-forming)